MGRPQGWVRNRRKTNNAIAWQAKRQSDRDKRSVLELYRDSCR